MMTKILLLTICLILSSYSYATAQAPDKVIYQDKEYLLNSNPLEPYFEKYPDKRPCSEWMNSSLWRGYVATFTFENDVLIVKDITIFEYDETFVERERPISMLEQTFSNKSQRMLKYFSGIMVLPIGEVIDYVHLGYGSVYENYILLQVTKGKLTDSVKFTGDEYYQYKVKQFEVYKKSAEYKVEMAEFKKEPDEDFNAEAFIFSLYPFTEQIMLPFRD